VEREGRKQYLGLRDAAYVKYARKSVGYEPIILSSVVFRRSDSATRARTDRIRFPMAGVTVTSDQFFEIPNVVE
jgi:hypothetical protein